MTVPSTHNIYLFFFSSRNLKKLPSTTNRTHPGLLSIFCMWTLTWYEEKKTLHKTLPFIRSRLHENFAGVRLPTLKSLANIYIYICSERDISLTLNSIYSSFYICMEKDNKEIIKSGVILVDVDWIMVPQLHSF